MNNKQKNGDAESLAQKHRSDPSNPAQIALIKRAVRDTFHKIKQIETELEHMQRIRAVLKHDLIDLKEGRLDRIVNRHEIDAISKVNSIFSINQKIEINARQVSQWYVPYSILFKDDKNPPSVETINNSLAKIHAAGACQLSDGEIKYL